MPAIGAAVGLLSSVSSYSLEINALAALVLIGERLSRVEGVAMACVVGASRWG